MARPSNTLQQRSLRRTHATNTSRSANRGRWCSLRTLLWSMLAPDTDRTATSNTCHCHRSALVHAAQSSCTIRHQRCHLSVRCHLRIDECILIIEKFKFENKLFLLLLLFSKKNYLCMKSPRRPRQFGPPLYKHK